VPAKRNGDFERSLANRIMCSDSENKCWLNKTDYIIYLFIYDDEEIKMLTNVPPDSRHLQFIDGWHERTVVGQQQSDNLESVEVLVTNDGALAVVIGKLQLGFHQQTVQHPTVTAVDYQHFTVQFTL